MKARRAQASGVELLHLVLDEALARREKKQGDIDAEVRSPQKRHVPETLRAAIFARDKSQCCYQDPLSGMPRSKIGSSPWVTTYAEIHKSLKGKERPICPFLPPLPIRSMEENGKYCLGSAALTLGFPNFAVSSV